MPFDTMLSQENERRFQVWMRLQSQMRNRDMTKDLKDYDLRGYWLNGGFNDKGKGHMPDTYKKPNHPTFSDESMYHDNDKYVGGHWNEDGSFTAGKTNLENYGEEGLKKYFKRVEPDAKLIIVNY